MKRPVQFRILKFASITPLFLLLSGCGDNGLFGLGSTDRLDAEHIKQIIPGRVQARQSWADDIYNIMNDLKIERSRENVCSVVAVVDQESNFHADPVVYGLGEKAVHEINSRLKEKFEAKLGKSLGQPIAEHFEKVLKTQPSPEDNYLSQMRRVKTERELDVLYREIFDYMAGHYHVSALTGAAKLVGQDFGEKMNPITTLGSMQVHIRYAQAHKRSLTGIDGLRDDLYSQYGGLYYGIHRLMMYPADYEKPLYRFADYNSGMYSSRNAAFQSMLNDLTEAELDLDGDLLLYSKDGDLKAERSQSEKELIHVFTANNILVTPRQIRLDLKQEKEKDFENTQTYIALKKLYEAKTGQKAAYAIMPKVVISGPKLSREYNTNWFASRVNGRYETCMQRAKRLKL